MWSTQPSAALSCSALTRTQTTGPWTCFSCHSIFDKLSFLKIGPEIVRCTLQTIWHRVRKDSCIATAMLFKLPVNAAEAASASPLPSQEEEEKKEKKESINTSTSSMLNLALSGSMGNSWWQLSKVSKFRQSDSPFSQVSPSGDNNQASHDEFHSQSGADYGVGRIIAQYWPEINFYLEVLWRTYSTQLN